MFLHQWPALPAELTIVIPTFEERGNVPILLERFGRVLDGIAYEVVVVDDDSCDGTGEEVSALARKDPRVRCIRRVGRRGLSGACLEGILSSTAPVVAVMDADLQHDETLLPRMLAEIRAGADLAIGSRYVVEGAAAGGFDATRAAGSRLATLYARYVLRLEVKDPLSGFFMLRRDVVQEAAHRLSRHGFKILLDILATSSRPLAVRELPYMLGPRLKGTSKMDSLAAIHFAALVLSRASGGLLPPRFILFAAIGSFGIIVHLRALQLADTLFGLDLVTSQIIATFVAMTANYMLNNTITYRDLRLTGIRFWIGLLTFYLVCSLGTLANVGVATMIYDSGATRLVAGFAGAIMSAVFNYAASRALTWRSP